jgi:hypothetical protein
MGDHRLHIRLFPEETFWDKPKIHSARRGHNFGFILARLGVLNS